MVVRKQSKDAEDSIGNIVNTISITSYGARQVLEITGGTLCKVCGCLTTILHM